MTERASKRAREWLRPKAETMTVCAMFLSLALPLSAQEISIHAEVDKTVAALNDQIRLTVTVSGNQTDLPDPALPAMPNFSVYSSGRSQNISFVNGAVASAVEYAYLMVPRFVGKAVIDPISITVGVRKFETSPIEVQIVRPSQATGAAPSPTAPVTPRRGGAKAPTGGFGPDVFVTATLDKSKAVVNEQVTLTVRFHTSVPLLGNPEYVPPTTNGFLTEDLPPERHGQMEIRGRLYNYSEIKTALFPAQPGRLTVSPAVVRAQVQSAVAVDPFSPDFFQKFFSQGMLSAQTRELKSDPLSVSVEPLPAQDKPESFAGAVGQFRLTAAVDRRQVKAGEAVNLTVAIEGAGNLKALGTPKLPDMPQLRVYDTVSSMNLNKEKDVVRGSKVYRTVLIPKVSGTLQIPSIPFGYYDTAKREYVRAATPPIELEVAAAAPMGGPPTSFVSPGAGSGEVNALVEDILYVKETRSESWPSRALTALSRSAWVHLLPLTVFLASLSTSVHRQRLSLDPAGARARSALSRAERLLGEAEAAASEDHGKAANRAAEALAGFIADKLNRPPSGLTLREALDSLRSRYPRLGEEPLARLKDLWEGLDGMRFAGGEGAQGGSTHAMAAGVRELLEDLDKGMRQ